MLTINFLQHPFTSSILGPNILLGTHFSNTFNLCSAFKLTKPVSHQYKTTIKYAIHFIRFWWKISNNVNAYWTSSTVCCFRKNWKEYTNSTFWGLNRPAFSGKITQNNMHLFWPDRRNVWSIYYYLFIFIIFYLFRNTWGRKKLKRQTALENKIKVLYILIFTSVDGRQKDKSLWTER
jgi:hypothetical protein